MAGVNLATAYYTLIPSMGGNQSAIAAQMGAAGDTSAKSFSSKFSGGLKGPILAAGIAGAAAAAVGFIKGSITEAREAQKVGALTASVIKSTGGAANITATAVGNLSTAISNKTGIDDEAVQTGANLLLTFKNVQNQAGAGNKIFNQATAAAVDLSAAGFGSIETASKTLGKALNDPVKGVTALGRAGVTFTDAQKKQIAAMVKAGDVLGAQKIILGEVKSQVGGAAAATATSGEKMSVAWGNLQETIGTKLLPILDRLEAGLSTVFNFIAAHQSVMIAIAAVIGVVLVAALVAAAAAAWSFTIALLANPIVWIIIAIIALIAGIVLLVKNWDLVKAKTIAIWNTIKTFLVGLWNGLKASVASAWDSIKTAVVTKATAMLTWIQALPGKIVAFFKALPGQLKTIGIAIVTGLRDGIEGAWHFVTDKVKSLIALIPLAIRKLLHIASPSRVMVEIGGYVAEGLALGMDRGQAGVQSSALALAGSVGGPISARPSFGAGSAGAPSDRPILMSDGTLFGWVRQIANGEAELVLNRSEFESGVYA